jgi:hypothetical protein
VRHAVRIIAAMRFFKRKPRRPTPQFEVGDVVKLTKIFAANTGGPTPGDYLIKEVRGFERVLYNIQSVRDGPTGRIAWEIPEEFLTLVRRHD